MCVLKLFLYFIQPVCPFKNDDTRQKSLHYLSTSLLVCILHCHINNSVCICRTMSLISYSIGINAYAKGEKRNLHFSF